MTAETAPTQYIQGSNGVRFAYRTIGTPSEVPLILHNHFRANMDWWDPALINAIATTRQVIVFDSAGVGRSDGQVPDSFQGWAEHLIDFVAALGVNKVDLFGYSMGARAVQMTAVIKPDLVRKMVLAGASSVAKTPDTPAYVRDPKYMWALANAVTLEESQRAFRIALFGESEAGEKLWDAYWERVQGRTVEPIVSDALALEPGGKNQIQVVLTADVSENTKWPDPLASLTMPVLVANGKDDLVLATMRTLDLYNRLPNAELVLYPNSGHGFLFQCGEQFGRHVNSFLDTNSYDPPGQI